MTFVLGQTDQDEFDLDDLLSKGENAIEDLQALPDNSGLPAVAVAWLNELRQNQIGIIRTLMAEIRRRRRVAGG